MSELHIGPHTRKDEEPGETFDREINVRAIVWSVVGLLVVALVFHLIVWGMIKGMNRFDASRDPRRSPLPEANKQPDPPLPHLQRTPELDLKAFREEEDRKLRNIDEAMKAIAERGLGPEVVGGTPVTPTPPVQERR